jgi:hypothetical protein
VLTRCEATPYTARATPCPVRYTSPSLPGRTSPPKTRHPLHRHTPEEGSSGSLSSLAPRCKMQKNIVNTPHQRKSFAHPTPALTRLTLNPPRVQVEEIRRRMDVIVEISPGGKEVTPPIECFEDMNLVRTCILYQKCQK